MTILVEKLFHSIKLPSKLENRHNRHYHRYETSLQNFYSYISVAKILPRSECISLSWVTNCFNYLFNLNKAFARLVVEIDYPMTKWEIPLIEDYLNYSLRLLDHLNLVKSSLSHLVRDRLLIAHALSLIKNSPSSAIERLKVTEFENLEIDCNHVECVKERKLTGKELLIAKALMEMRKNSDLVFGIVFSSLSGSVKPYVDLKIPEANLKGFINKKVVFKEFEEVNDAKARLLETLEMGDISESSDEDVKNLEIKLDEIRKQLDDIRSKADDLFRKILAGRNKLLDVIR